MPSPKTWESKRCGAKLHKDDPESPRCKRWAVRGLDRCPIHGGGTPASKKKAARVRSQATIKAAVVTYGAPIDIDPVDALLEELARTNGHIKRIGEKIRELDESALIWGTISTTDRSGADDENNWSEEKVGAQMHMWIDYYFRERAHLVKLSDLMVKNGLQEMQVTLQARQVEIFEHAMLAMLQDLRIDPSRPEVRVIMGTRLTEAATAAQQPLEIARR